ncbi:MAG: PKD domain-containing protein, partial [Salinivirgaceae bacterium]
NTFTVAETGTYYFAWEAYGDADQFGLYVDNIEISQVFDTDMTVKNALINYEVDENCMPQTVNAITAVVENAGTTTIENFNIASTINGVDNTPQAFTQTIAAGDTAHVLVTNDIALEYGTSYNITISIESDTDQNAANNSFFLTDFSLDEYSTSFEETDDNENWTQLSVAGANEWEVLDDVNNAYTGTQYYAVRTDGANGNDANDDWLFSGCRYLEANTCYEITFKYRSRWSTENLTLFMGTDATPEAMTTELFDDPSFDTNAYIQGTAQVSVDEAGAYFFGFHTDGGTSGRYYVLLDDLTIRKSEAQPYVEVDTYELGREVVFETYAENVASFYWDFYDGATSTEQSPTHTFAENGTYEVSMVASSQCGNATFATTIVQDFEVLEADFDFVVDEATVDFTAATNANNITWSFGDGNHASGSAVANTYAAAGDHSVTMTAYSPYDYMEIVKTITTTVGISNVYSSQVQVYPNPAGSHINIASETQMQKADIYDISGKLQSSHKISGTNAIINLDQLEAGTYFIRITTDTKSFPVKLIIQ